MVHLVHTEATTEILLKTKKHSGSGLQDRAPAEMQATIQVQIPAQKTVSIEDITATGVIIMMMKKQKPRAVILQLLFSNCFRQLWAFSFSDIPSLSYRLDLLSA